METSDSPPEIASMASPVDKSSSSSSSSSSSERAHASSPPGDGSRSGDCALLVHDTEVLWDDRRCSTSSQVELEMAASVKACDIHGDGAAGGLDRCVVERITAQDDQDRHEEDSPPTADNAVSAHCGANSSDFSMDVEQGWGSGHAKQMATDEEGPGECCRVCHLTAERGPSVGEIIKLGCSCKDDLALAHRRCAETWFKIRGDPTCEICGSIAQNIAGNSDDNCEDQSNDIEANSRRPGCVERCWQTQPLCNTLIVCLLLVLIASWLFRVTLF